MRSICTSLLAAAALAVPAVTRSVEAQEFTLRHYTIGGCFTGYVYASPDHGLVSGTPFCATGVAALAVRSTVVPGVGEFYLSGTIDEVFNPAFTGPGVGPSDGTPFIFARYSGSGCGDGGCQASGQIRYGTFLGGTPPHGAFEFSAALPFGIARADVATVELLPSPFEFAYTLPGRDPLDLGPLHAEGYLTFTATPEPAPLALTAVALGGLALLGAARPGRRR